MNSTSMICITCPIGCGLEVTHEESTLFQISGNKCKRGIDYARAELEDPRRMVATTVRVHGGIHPLVPVYAQRPFPKHLIFELMQELAKIELEAPIRSGQVVLRSALGTGIDIIASRDLESSGHAP